MWPEVTMTARNDDAVFAIRRSSDIGVYFETATKTVITRLLLLLSLQKKIILSISFS